jgi:hypothetical protein
MADAKTQILLLPLMVYAACGLVLSLAAHLSALVGLQLGGTALFFGLHVGIFPLWIAVVFISMKMMGGTRLTMGRSSAFRNAMFFGCPAWMKYMTNAFFIYAIVNFIIFVMIIPAGSAHSADAPPSSVWRGFSGHWMVFYSAGLATVTSAYRRGLSNLERRCPNGHVVGLGDRFCATCGVPTDEQSALDRWR